MAHRITDQDTYRTPMHYTPSDPAGDLRRALVTVDDLHRDHRLWSAHTCACGWQGDSALTHLLDLLHAAGFAFVGPEPDNDADAFEVAVQSKVAMLRAIANELGDLGMDQLASGIDALIEHEKGWNEWVEPAPTQKGESNG